MAGKKFGYEPFVLEVSTGQKIGMAELIRGNGIAKHSASYRLPVN